MKKIIFVLLLIIVTNIKADYIYANMITANSNNDNNSNYYHNNSYDSSNDNYDNSNYKKDNIRTICKDLYLNIIPCVNIYSTNTIWKKSGY